MNRIQPNLGSSRTDNGGGGGEAPLKMAKTDASSSASKISMIRWRHAAKEEDSIEKKNISNLLFPPPLLSLPVKDKNVLTKMLFLVSAPDIAKKRKKEQKFIRTYPTGLLN